MKKVIVEVAVNNEMFSDIAVVSQDVKIMSSKRIKIDDSIIEFGDGIQITGIKKIERI